MFVTDIFSNETQNNKLVEMGEKHELELELKLELELDWN